MRISLTMFFAATAPLSRALRIAAPRAARRASSHRPGVALAGARGKRHHRGRWEAPALAGAAGTLACYGSAVADAEWDGDRVGGSWAGVIDKETTGVPALRSRVAAGDGRGVLVAVLDTGVDPAAEGLLATPDGSMKVVDVIDATGSGDVDVSTKVTVPADGWVTNAASGRRLRLDASKWTVDGKPCENPEGMEFRLGAKRTDALWPAALRGRLAAADRASFDAAVAPLRAAARAARDAAVRDGSADAAELDARVEALNAGCKALKPSRESAAPLLDVVTWREPSSGAWRCVAIDGAAGGDLVARAADVTVLGDFRVATAAGERSSRWGTFGDEDLLTCSASFYEGGDVVALVVPAGDHGTHVAAIVGAYDAADPDKCGVAPACKIVSIKIGDSRLGTMETGAGLCRALVACRRLGVDLVNLSYGEAACLCDVGRFVELSERLVRGNDKGAIFCSSAGNNGPALSTVGAPGATSSALLGIGAYVNPAMCGDLYAMRSPAVNPGGAAPGSAEEAHRGGVLYSFSSRGPSPDGGPGVSVVAPGGAVASIPKYTLQPQRLMHGTSMSSPNACGSLACLVGALKAENVPYTPDAVRRAVEASATPLPGVPPTDQGRGLLAVDAAFDLLADSAGARQNADVRYEVAVPSRAPGGPGAPPGRGIYLRELAETSAPAEVAVSVAPRFQNDALVAAQAKADFRRNVVLESTAPWVTVGEKLVLTHAGKALTVKVDPTQACAVGRGPATAQVVGRDADADPGAPPLFVVPVTVVRPSPPQETVAFPAQTFEAGAIARAFVAPPEGAGSATLKVSCRPTDASSTRGRRLFHVHSVQLGMQESYASHNVHKRAWLHDGDDFVYELADLAPGRTLEVCLSQDWNSLEPCHVEATLTFKAGVNEAGDVVLRGTRSLAELDAHLPAWSRESVVVSPQLKLKTWRRPLRPLASRIKPCVDGERDAWPGDAAAAAGDGRREDAVAYELELDYEWAHPKDGVAATVGLRFAGDELVYDAPVEGQHAEVRDKETRKAVGWRDARVYGDAAKGCEGGRSYEATLTLRHDDPAVLETMRDAECWLEHALTKEIACPVYSHKHAGYAGDASGKMKEVKLLPGERKRAYGAPPKEKDLPKDAQPGDVLLGTVSMAREAANSEGPSRRAASTLWYHVPPRSKNTKDPKPKPPKKNATDDAGDAAAARTFLGAAFASLDDTAAVALANATLAKHLATLKKEAPKLALADEALFALGDAVAAYDADKKLEVATRNLERAAAKASPRWRAAHGDIDGVNGTQPVEPGNASLVVDAAAALRAGVDEAAVARHRATRAPDEDAFAAREAFDAAKAARATDAASYSALLAALRWTAEARAALAKGGGAEEAAALGAALADLEAWVDPKKGAAADARLKADQLAGAGKPGLALGALNAFLSSKKAKTASPDDLTDLSEARRSLYAVLGWQPLADAAAKKLLDDLPPKGATP